MNILLSLTSYNNLTGSEIYAYELARCLTLRRHKVSIIANKVGGDLADRTRALGIEIYSYFDRVDIKHDVVHMSQPGPTAYCLRTFPDALHIVTVHSQLIYEQPIIDDRIKHYICIRPEIRDHVLDTFTDLDKNRLSVVYNGVDPSRFNTDITDQNPNSVLFVGTYDYLRANAIKDLILRTKNENKELILVTPHPQSFKDNMPDHVKLYSPTWDVEKYTKYCGTTAGIYLGRTTIEGWMCGKKGWIYDVTDEGAIKSIDLYDVPADLSPFDIETMTTNILDIYNKYL